MLTVKAFSGMRNGRAFWECLCECGNTWIGKGNALSTGNTKSCGCLQDNSGESGSRLYVVWASMLQRARNQSNKDYDTYGARGITVDESFLRFSVFRDCLLEDAGEWPGPGYSVDRKDNSKGYQPGNLRWATWNTQQRNKRSNRIVEISGQKMSLAEAVEKYGTADYTTIKKRLNRGWIVEKALSTPSLKKTG